jgi:hypothetical protein
MSTTTASKRRSCWSRPAPAGSQREEVAEYQAAPRVRGQRRGGRDQPAPVPVDHHVQRLHHHQRAHLGVLEHGPRRVAQPQSADDHVQVRVAIARPGQPLERQVRQRDLRVDEHARHQEVVVQLDLEDVLPRDRVPAAPQADLAHRRLLPVELLESGGHPSYSAP